MKIIIVEDQKKTSKEIIKIANQILKRKKIKLEIKLYEDYSKELERNIIKSNGNIYILDIELPTKNGFDIARLIRQTVNDWKSIIIIASAYDQKSAFISSQLSILTYISKFVDFSTELDESLNLALNILIKDQTIKMDGKNVLIDDILYIQKEKNSKYCTIKCFNDEYRVRKSLVELQKESNLEKIRKDLLINRKNTISIKDNEIVFKNNIKVN